MNKINKASLGLLLALGASTAFAQQSGFNQSNFYMGAGLGYNDLDGPWDNAVGFQVFGGYDFGLRLGSARTALEVGYMDTGDFESDVCYYPYCYKYETNATGLWANGVVALPLSPAFDLIGRLGFDFGDDDGFMAGIGAGFSVSRQVQIRGEYVARDHIDSLQANFLYRF